MTLKLSPALSFSRIGDRFFLINHRTGEELLLNEDAGIIIESLAKQSPLPREALPFVAELQQHGIVIDHADKTAQTPPFHKNSTADIYSKVKEQATQRHIPFSAHLELVKRCPLHCTHCYLKDVPVERHKELSTAEWIRIIDELRSLGTFHVTVTGGEPFIRTDIMDILRAIRERHMALSILSSGFGISTYMAEEIADLFPLAWQTSIYGNEEYHDTLTKTPGSFQSMMRTATLLKQRGISVRLSAVITKPAIKHINFIKELCDSHGFILSFSTLLMPTLTGTELPSYLQLTAEERKLVMKQTQISPPSRPAHYPCNAARSVVAVDHTGNILPCIEWRQSAGSAAKQSVASIWNNSRLLTSIRSLSSEDLTECSHCSLREQCSRCPGHAIRQGNGATGKDVWACETAQLLSNLNR